MREYLNKHSIFVILNVKDLVEHSNTGKWKVGKCRVYSSQLSNAYDFLYERLDINASNKRQNAFIEYVYIVLSPDKLKVATHLLSAAVLLKTND